MCWRPYLVWCNSPCPCRFSLNPSWTDWGRAETVVIMGFPGGSMIKIPPANEQVPRVAENSGLIPRLGRSPGEGNGNPVQHFARKIPWTEEPGGLLSIGLQRVRHDWSSWAQCHKYVFAPPQPTEGTREDARTGVRIWGMESWFAIYCLCNLGQNT